MKRNEMGLQRGVSEKEKTGAVLGFLPAVKMEYQEIRPNPSYSIHLAVLLLVVLGVTPSG